LTPTPRPGRKAVITASRIGGLLSRAAVVAIALLAPVPVAVVAQPAPGQPVRHEIWDIPLGAAVPALPDDFVDFACGTGGGPPSRPLTGFADWRRCRPGADGLYEVYFRYDDEIEYWAKANNLADQMEQYIGTKTYGFPVTVSALIGDDGGAGTVRGIRIVSDPRDPTGDRDEAYLLRNFLNARFGRDGWRCEQEPAGPGETAVAGTFIKERCEKELEGGVHSLLVTRHLRKPGQSQYDPHSGRETTNQFESSVRFELVTAR
jgi:hypothetical protein